MPNQPLDLTDPLVGQQLSSFRIDKIIKRGGMAQVYKGWDVMLERPVAIKVIDTRFRSNPSYAERFLREARAVATWRHEHIVQVYYADVQDGLYYFAMEYVDGMDLAEMLARYLADGLLMPQQDVLRIGEAVAKALAYAHQHGVVHRDLKPSNVMLDKRGEPIVTDFGLASRDAVTESGLTHSGLIIGSPAYMAPEQVDAAHDKIGPRTDVYALGVILYQLLTGRRPFDGA
ncbi:MAG: serine/threonine protein kinase, partial [Anaerolineales bacterium]|nr:serine/threonine protein kinase [Anaerolineales bacterium]